MLSQKRIGLIASCQKKIDVIECHVIAHAHTKMTSIDNLPRELKAVCSSRQDNVVAGNRIRAVPLDWSTEILSTLEQNRIARIARNVAALNRTRSLHCRRRWRRL